MSLSVYKPSPLTYPGRLPGFDPAHPATMGATVFFSAVPSAANFVNLLRGSAGTVTNAPVFLLDGRIGPTVKFANTTDAVTFAGQSTVADQTCVMGAIVVMNSVANANEGIFSSASNGSGGFLMNVASAAFTLNLNGVNAFSSGINLTTGVPYFLAISTPGGTGKINFVVARLDTGKILSAAVSTSGTAGPPSGTYSVGTRVGSNLVSLASIAAVMFTNGFVSMPTLLAWASDPWAFWYPRTLSNQIFDGLNAPAATAAFQAAWALNRNAIIEGVAT